MAESGPLFVADEGFNRDIIRGVLSRTPNLSIIRVQEVGLSGASDPAILEWAAQAGRIVLTHDKNTMRADAIVRLNERLPMPRVVVVHQETPTGRAIQRLQLMITSSQNTEWENQIRFVVRR
jgi:predicted nuclease of predicted toxin-antitoxin system